MCAFGKIYNIFNAWNVNYIEYALWYFFLNKTGAAWIKSPIVLLFFFSGCGFLCVLKCMFRFPVFCLYVIDMVLVLLCYVEVWRWPTAAVNNGHLKRYRWYLCILWFTESGEPYCLGIWYVVSDFVWNTWSYIHDHEPTVNSWHRWRPSIVHSSHIFPALRLLTV